MKSNDFKDILPHLPWYWRWCHHIVTFTLLLIIAPPLLLALANPLWFREAFLEWCCEGLTTALIKVRLWLLGSVYEKYTLFETLKQ